MTRWFRLRIGNALIWWGYRLLPKEVRLEVSKTIQVGYEWLKHGKPEQFEMTITPNKPER